MKKIFENTKIEINNDSFCISFDVGEGKKRQRVVVDMTRENHNNIEFLCNEMIKMQFQALEYIKKLNESN